MGSSIVAWSLPLPWSSVPPRSPTTRVSGGGGGGGGGAGGDGAGGDDGGCGFSPLTVKASTTSLTAGFLQLALHCSPAKQ